ncbi:hypothetical protein HDU88_006549 [Geranomyces variabilis]|nr:hypothetical protein HDU88_006549 [Geranomyces variabilis]
MPAEEGGNAESGLRNLLAQTNNIPATTALGEVKAARAFTVYGVVISFRPVRSTHGSDHVLTVCLTDPTMPAATEGLTINLFDSLSRLPEVQAVGTVLKCTIRVQMYGYKYQGVSIKSQAPVATALSTLGNDKQSAEDTQIAEFLTLWWQRVLERFAWSSPSVASTGMPGRPVFSVSQIKHPNVFCDMCVQVVSSYPTQGNRITLLVTDYTENEVDLVSQVALDTLPLPFSANAVLSCTLWDDHVQEGEQLLPGAYVFLRNVRTKCGNYGLEVNMHAGRHEPDVPSVMFLQLDDPVVVEMQKREHAYREKLTAGAVPPDPLRPTAAEPPIPPNPPRRQEPISTPSAPAHTTGWGTAGDCSTSSDSVQKWRVRVIDHVPPDIRDFCRPICQSCASQEVPQKRSCNECATSSDYAYEFSLLLAHENGRCVSVGMHGKSAEKLISIPPVDFHQSPKALDQLRKKLAMLWDIPPACNEPPVAGQPVVGAGTRCLDAFIRIVNLDQAGVEYTMVGAAELPRPSQFRTH